MDSIAQESNETFTLTLDPLVPPNPREGLYFKNIAQITIIDSDGKLLTFCKTIIIIEVDHSSPTQLLAKLNW